jgi:dipeptidyl aminopeptidase/acylaminoacyl peptidase
VFLGDLGSKSKTRLIAAESNAIYGAPGYILFRRAASLFAQPFDAKGLALKGDPIHLADEVASDTGGRGHFDVSQSGVLLYYQGSETTIGRANTQPNVQLGWVNRSGGFEAYAGDAGPYGDMDLSPDGKLIAVTEQTGGASGADIWVIDWQRAGVATRLTLDPADDLNPIWSPDGTRIAFTSYRKGNADIYIKNANGVGAETPILESPVDEMVKDWSKDGRYLVYLRGEDEFRDIHALQLEDGKPAREAKPFPVVQGHFHKDQPQFSYDGKWMAYTSDETGTYQINVVSFPAADQKLQVSVSGGGQPRWRKDGKDLYFREPNSGAVMMVEMKAGAKLDAGPPQTLFRPPFSNAWTTDPVRHLLAVNPDGQRFLLRWINRTQNAGGRGSSAPVVQTAVAGAQGGSGRFNRFATSNNGLTVIQHWTSALVKPGR